MGAPIWPRPRKARFAVAGTETPRKLLLLTHFDEGKPGKETGCPRGQPVCSSRASALRARRVADAAGIHGYWLSVWRWLRLRIWRGLCGIGSRHWCLSRGSLVGNADGRPGDDEFNAAILLAAGSGAVVRHRIGHAISDSADIL